MAFVDDLQSFLETRLISYDPSIDLSANSPAQLKIITPIIQRFGEDPFETDIPSFIRDRIVQEYPDMAADNGGMLEDILTKVHQLLLEPFKREIELVKIGSSFANADIMADAEAEALGANWFTDRDGGDFASGPVRLFFAQPTTTRVSTDKQVSTNDGRAYFPVQTYLITVSQMAFNRQGSFYFLDITVRAETQGDTYNVDIGDITSIQDVPGVIKVANLTAFITGAPKEDNSTYIGRIESGLTERSMVTKRGALARIDSEFPDVRAIQVIGAGEEGMDRDLLTGTGQGFLHLSGSATMFGNWLYISELVYLDDGPTNSITPQPGDTIRFHAGAPSPTTDVVEATVVSILSPGFLFLLDSSPFGDGDTQDGAFALLKPGNITISGVPGGIAADVTVADNTVHLGGHTDIFARPTEDAEVQTTINNVTDDAPVVAILDLVVPVGGQNLVDSGSSDFDAAGVIPGDLLVIDTGAGFAGTYQILEVPSANSLRVSEIFPLATVANLRARVVRNIRLDLVAPRIPKLPFTDSPVSDLQTNVGSNEFLFTLINVQDYGATQGDTIHIIEGADAGEFTIIGFGGFAGSVFVDRVASATGANISYEIYTKQTGLVLPLVRLKGIEVLDSTGQTTGITVPYGDAVDIRPDCNFETAGHGKTTYDKQIIIFPDLSEWASGGLTPDPVGLGSVTNHTDARYTLGLAVADGIIRKITSDASNQIQTTEINVPPFLYNGRRDKLLALVAHEDNDYPTTIPGTHTTSDVANAKIGDSITLNDGPNQGKYIILDIRILELWGKADTGHRKVALLQVDPPLKVDPIRSALDLINLTEATTVFDANALFGFLQYAADWDNASGFYTTFAAQLAVDLVTKGIVPSMTTDQAKAFFDPLVRASYTVGPSAVGTMRTYFLEPVSAEFRFGTDPTTFDLAVDGSKTFRVDPGLPSAQILPESITPTFPSLWERDLGVRLVQDQYAFLTTDASFAARGIEAGDVIEYYPAINDLPSRLEMSSSWLCTTQAGSNVVQLILPQSNGTSPAGYGGVDNFTNLAAGQLFYLDSGPDTGAYTITKVITQNWGSNPPVLVVQLDQTLTHSTENFPVLTTAVTPPAQVDFGSVLPGFVEGTALTFPIALNGKHLKVDISTDGGVSYTSYEHLFVTADPYASMTDVINDIAGDGAFTTGAQAVANGTKLDLVSGPSGPLVRIRINSAPTSPSAHTTLGLINGTIGAGFRGGGAASGTKRVYGTGMTAFAVGDWITLYAANSLTILTNGDDAAYLGTFQVTATGTDQAAAPYWESVDEYIEIDRTANFPTDIAANVRYLRHETPDIAPTATSGGGTEISDQFVRFRLYDSVSRKVEILNIPWSAATIHPLLATSDQQVQLAAPGIVDTANGQRNYSYESPFRILRPDILRISSTEMATQREGALYYVDIPVVGYGPGAEMNVTPADGFLLSGTRRVEGYTLEVHDEIFTYSTQEQVHLILPNSVLPAGSTADLSNQFNLSGQNLQITYNNAPVVEDLQAFVDSQLDRVTAANMLVRHFLPAYVMLDAVYAGGSVEATVATEIITYINNIDPDTAEIRTDLLKDAITRRGATTVDLPLTVIALFHGIDRRIRGMRSTKSIGIGDTPFFKGTFKQTYFIAGPDTSSQSPRPVGEQIFLRRT